MKKERKKKIGCRGERYVSESLYSFDALKYFGEAEPAVWASVLLLQVVIIQMKNYYSMVLLRKMLFFT